MELTVGIVHKVQVIRGHLSIEYIPILDHNKP
jgi:hypothetical protein